ncbi:NAD(P)H-binding protein [Altererythrobacter buctensis]|uniref:NAD(P)H-binding protein n=1 Tax=Alteraurantiacibacter buctensis TaxID=1503981 RepID=A0A844Z1F0_9SPHN|nr:NAD(P)H-binding protein [Alteraurantiacibacter buctensis]
MLAITGGTGFLGSHVLEQALGQGLRPQALTRRMGGAHFGSGVPQPLWIEGTLADPAALAMLAEGADAVLHIAGAVNVPTREAFAAANIAGTQAVVEAARAAGVRRFIHVSSLAAREPGLSAYGWSKAGAEEVVRQSGLDWTIVRPPAIYGPRDRDMFEMFRAAKLGVLPVPPAGAASVIHAADLARLLLAAAHGGGPDWSERLFEPDDGRPGGWAHPDLARAIGSAMGRRVWAPGLPAPVLRGAARLDRLARGDKAKLTPDRASYMLHPDWVSSPALAVPEHLWTPAIPTLEGLAQTAAWYQANGWV